MAKPKPVSSPSVSSAVKKDRLRYANVMTFVVTILIAGGISYVQIAQPTVLFTKTANAPQKQETTVAAPATQPEAKTDASAAQASPPADSATTSSSDSAASVPAAAPAAKTATTVSFVHMRAGKGTGTAIVADLDGGVVVQLRDDADPTWQGVTYNGQVGYIYKDYLHY